MGSILSLVFILLKECQQSVKSSGCNFILGDGFNVIFSVLQQCNKDLSLDYKGNAFEIVLKAMEHLIQTLDQTLGGGNIGRLKLYRWIWIWNLLLQFFP